MENDQTKSNLFITSNNINIELNKEFLEELQKNTYHGWIDEDVVNHIAKVLEIVDLIHIPDEDSNQLRMKVFPLSLTDDACQWWKNKRGGKITIWEELVEKFFVNFTPNHTMEKKKCWTKETTGRIDDSILSSNNTTSESFFKPYLKSRGKSDTEKEDEQSQTKRKYSNTSTSINEQPNKEGAKQKSLRLFSTHLDPTKNILLLEVMNTIFGKETKIICQ
ncbi:uncharacterized mitochondrial protein-like protein [Tanacetum coccineum]|uniref:Uncharacterized mitochondrial protein-like protein n=1 Tax=Tanacetum coccineum TaxID=301880 RepID=A0ABQ4XCQ8_9ASTR